MHPIIPLGDIAWASSGAENKLNWDGLPDEIGDRPAAVLAIIVDVTLNLNSAAGGAGITGRNMFDVLKSILIKTGIPGEEARVNNLSGGMCRILETQMLGIEPPVPTDLAAAGGAVTRQLRITIPMADLSVERPIKDTAVPVAVLKKKGSIQFNYAASPSALGGNANDTIASATAKVQAVLTDLNEGHVVQPCQFEWMDKNGANDATFKAGAYRYATIIQQSDSTTGAEFAAGTITDFTSLHVGKNEVLRQMTGRALIEKFNKDRIREAASRRVAPADTASGVSDFVPLMWPSQGDSGLAVPHGSVRFVSTGTTQNFRLLVMDVRLGLSKDERDQVLIDMGYRAKKVRATPAAARVPVTKRPGLKGHLRISPRKRALLPQRYVTLSKEDRGKVVDET